MSEIDKIEKYLEYSKLNNTRWDFGNKVLYDLCEKETKHNDEHKIVAKIWLIGRSYAAAIERRKNAEVSNDDFYYNKVAPSVLEIGNELDKRIEYLNSSEKPIEEEIEYILETHNFLTEVFYKITGLSKRSLASKYLHFHCPDKFFIYDSRAQNAINKLVKKTNKKVFNGLNNADEKYKNFVLKMLELKKELNDHNIYPSPRELDSFLLYIK